MESRIQSPGRKDRVVGPCFAPLNLDAVLGINRSAACIRSRDVEVISSITIARRIIQDAAAAFIRFVIGQQATLGKDIGDVVVGGDFRGR